jgi:hypothetical protein
VGGCDRRQGEYRRAADILDSVDFQDEIPIEIDAATCVILDDIGVLARIDKANASAVPTQSVHLHIRVTNRAIAVVYEIDVGQRAAQA